MLFALATIDSAAPPDAAGVWADVDRQTVLPLLAWLDCLAPHAHPLAVPLRRHWLRTRRIVQVDPDSCGDAAGQAWLQWAWRANAIWVSENGRVLSDPARLALLDRDLIDDLLVTHPDAVIPAPKDARQRQAEVAAELRNRMVDPIEGAIPVPGVDEVAPRSAKETAERILALFVVATRAESILNGHPLDVERMRVRCPLGFDALSPDERAFFASPSPPADAFVWRYESLMCLQWALDMQFELPWPDEHADLTAVTRLMVDLPDQTIIEHSRLRSLEELLKEAERHQQLYFAVASAQSQGQEIPAGIDPGVVCERLIALSWLLDLPMASSWDEAIKWVDNGLTHS
ncbi:DUF4272 domain-containing protein [Neorhodopirellula pilleata]|uniref:DUF4272 domain-containing protein n=1 Tax=Neorhodopirellula pilleata TaxID=2714738 RepID=A0A5C6AUU0_9BACT|nr:DUF4272 domain-containing protein [Neorhodopirellula pilleata]TWU03358.1 hypothetical protein Pla100_02780 [Neorhodopirellula pilleata]